jgi:TonB family protein
MNYPVCGIAAYLICHALLFAASTSAQQNTEATAPLGSRRLVCTKKDPAPNCVSVPRVVSTPSPTYSEKGRKAKIERFVKLGLIVDEKGNPTNLSVISGLGMGLDEKAIEAVKDWKFEPAFGKDGKPVAVKIAVEVAFNL